MKKEYDFSKGKRGPVIPPDPNKVRITMDGLEQFVRKVSEIAVDLGEYESEEVTARVRDFYVINRELDEPLIYPDFDYEDWLPPRSREG